MKKFKTAVIGTGFIGVAHIEALRRLGNVDIVAICELHNAKAKAEALHVEKAYSDYEKMMNELDLDFVHVCTPNNTHYPIAKYALEHGIHVVLEKPLTMNIAEAEALVKLAKEKGLINAVNYHNRLYPACAYAKRLVNQGTLGDVISVSGRYVQDWLLYDTDYSWRLNRKESGKTRAVADIGSHWMDLAEYMSGRRIVEVFADFKTVYPKRKKAIGEVKTFSTSTASEYEHIDIDTEDMANLLFRFDNGAIGSLVVSQMAAGKKNTIELMVSGKKATLEWRLENLSDVWIGYRDKPAEIHTKDFQLMSDVADLIDYPSGHMEGFPDAFKQAFKQIYNQPDTPLYADFEAGLRQMILNDKIYESAMRNQWIKVDEVEQH